MHTQCSPSRATMMSGRYMHVLGHRTQIHLLRAYEENYFRLLKESAHVQWYGKNDALSQAAFNLSVSAWEPAIGYDSGKNAFPFGQSGYWSMTSTGGQTPANDTSQGDLRAVKLAVEFLQQKPSPQNHLSSFSQQEVHTHRMVPRLSIRKSGRMKKYASTSSCDHRTFQRSPSITLGHTEYSTIATSQA